MPSCSLLARAVERRISADETVREQALSAPRIYSKRCVRVDNTEQTLAGWVSRVTRKLARTNISFHNRVTPTADIPWVGGKPFRNHMYNWTSHPDRSALVAEAREIIIQVWLDHVVDVRDLPLQSPSFFNIALQSQVVHLRESIGPGAEARKGAIDRR